MDNEITPTTHNTCVKNHICNSRCHDDVHVDVGYDMASKIFDKEKTQAIQSLQMCHDEHCPLRFPHTLTVISIERAVEAPDVSMRYPGEDEDEDGDMPFLFTYKWNLGHTEK